MGSSVSKYLEDIPGYWDNKIKTLNKVMSDREIMDGKYPSKKIKEFMDDEANQIITIFEEEYPELSNEFQIIQDEQYELFARKMMDYGLNNVTLGGDIVNNSEDKKFSLTGLTIRLTDKTNRLKNLVVSGKQYVKDEGMEDTFIDIANYGIIGMLVGRNKWKK